MFGWGRRKASEGVIDRLHAAVAEAAREPAIYEGGGPPDTLEGRFEVLTLHVLLVLRRLKALPPPADDVAQDLVDAVFAHLEIALRESGIGDFGVPKRMKKLATAFYDRTGRYAAALDESDAAQLAAALAERIPAPGASAYGRFARYCLASERTLASADLDGLLAGPPFAVAALASVEPTASP